MEIVCFTKANSADPGDVTAFVNCLGNPTQFTNGRFTRCANSKTYFTRGGDCCQAGVVVKPEDFWRRADWQRPNMHHLSAATSYPQT